MSARDDRAFRRRLAEELPAWRAEGIIDAEAEAKLRARHPLDDGGAGLASAAIYVFGALLVGGGIISFVAWNWGRMPDAMKLGLLGATLIGVTAGGHHLWQVSRARERLGHALVLLGMLIFGANIGLVAQIFHVSSVWWHGWLAWAGGTILAAYLWRSLPISILSLAVAAVAAGGALDDSHGFWVPGYALALAFGPLVVHTRSRALFVLLASTSAGMLLVGLADAAENPLGFAFAWHVVAAFFLSLTFAIPPESRWRPLIPAATTLGFAGFGVALYASSFHDLAKELAISELKGASALAALAPLALLTALGLARGAARFAEHRATSAALLGIAGFFLATIIPPAELTVTVASHLALLLTAGLAIAKSVRGLERAPFWSGVAIIGLLILSRFLEFETELWLKAIVFIVAGLLVIYAGLVFERRLRAEAAHA